MFYIYIAAAKINHIYIDLSLRSDVGAIEYSKLSLEFPFFLLLYIHKYVYIYSYTTLPYVYSNGLHGNGGALSTVY